MISVDSIGANIAEVYGRYHYLDRIKFLYNSRGSYIESMEHWLELLFERKKVNETDFREIKELAKVFSIKLNNYISSIYRTKNKLK